MSIIEKLAQSRDLQTVYFYKEGVFWIAYEQSAYLVSQVKTLKPTKKYVKAVGQEVVSVGFPDTAMANILQSLQLITKNDLQVVAKSNESIEESAFEIWKSELPLQTLHKKVMKEISLAPLGSELLSILKRLQIFSLADKTPIECMFFLSDLQKQMQLHGNVQ